MVEWLKYFFGSFFINGLAMQGAERRVANSILAFFLGWILIFSGLVIGYQASFKTHFNNCSALIQSIEAVFENGIELKTSERKAVSGKNGEFDNSIVINTFSNADDKEKYSVNGINFILDTRPQDTVYEGEKTIRQKYIEDYLEKDVGDYIAILDDVVIGKFTTDGGLPVSFNGYYFKTDGVTVNSAATAKAFILKSFDGSSVLNFNIYFINLLKITPLIVLIPVLLALIVWGVDRIGKFSVFSKFGKTLKIECSFILVASVVTFLLTVLLSYFLPRGTVYSLVLVFYAATLLVRTIILAIMRFIGERRYYFSRKGI